MWRKRRLRLAEAAAHRRGLDGTLSSHRETVKVALVHLDAKGQSERVVDAIRATAADTEEDIADMTADEAMTRRALDLLGSKRNDAYEAALAALREDTQAWWADELARDPDELYGNQEPATADVEGLRRFIEGEVLPWFETRKKELANRPLIREQAFGEALDPDKLERLGRYEVHLDRKLERMLAMLLRLKDLRQGDRCGLIRLAKRPVAEPPEAMPSRRAGRRPPDSRPPPKLIPAGFTGPYGRQRRGFSPGTVPFWVRTGPYRGYSSLRLWKPKDSRAGGMDKRSLKRTRHLHQVHHARPAPGRVGRDAANPRGGRASPRAASSCAASWSRAARPSAPTTSSTTSRTSRSR